jgi:excisionase family DNA binding protein
VKLVETRRNDDFSYTPAEAAHILCVSPTRVRQLLQEGELEGERDEVGHWLIPASTVHERLERLRRESLLEAVGYDPSIIHAVQERVEVLRAQVEMLRAELEEAHSANRENRRIIAALTQRIPELEPPRVPEAPQEPQGSPQSAGTGPSGEEAPPAGDGAQESAEPRSWWRRVLGG